MADQQMTPAAWTLIGIDPTASRRTRPQHTEEVAAPEDAQQQSETRPVRNSRRVASYYNSFQTVCSAANDSPPSYAIAARQRPSQQRRLEGREVLPGYTCSVAAEAKLLLQLESVSPLHGVAEGEWRDIYVVLRGTCLNFHKVKDGKAGRLLRSYTLQHAEIGVAADSQHTVLIPQTRLARLIPSGARQRAWQKDPDLFKPVRQHILRLRVETDQILLADASEELIQSLIYAIGSGIDISHAIDERGIPRPCTVPRRRRRPRPAPVTGDLTDPILLAEQERILRDMYPAFAERTTASRPDLLRTDTTTTEDIPSEIPMTPTREEDELDFSMIREESGSSAQGDHSDRPTVSRQATSSSVNMAYAPDMLYATSPANFNPDRKWEPPHTRTPQQVQRYIRRCMPILLAEAARASDVIILHGTRVKINWRMELFEEWELQPPSYKSHTFGPEADEGLGLERTRSVSQNSGTASADQDNTQGPASVLGGEDEDQITRAENSFSNLDLTKIMTADKSNAPETPLHKSNHSEQQASEVHGVVFCF